MDNKNTKEKQVNYMYFPFDYGGIRGKIKQFFTAVCANTILLAELSPLYFGATIGADQIIFARTGFADFWLWSILGYILLGAILAAVYLVCLYFRKAGVYLYDDSTVVIKSVITYRRTFQHTFPYLRYGKKHTFRVWEISDIQMPHCRADVRWRKDIPTPYIQIMEVPKYGQFILLERMDTFVFTFVLQNNKTFYDEILKRKYACEEEQGGTSCADQ